jgi:hypothetical protein
MHKTVKSGDFQSVITIAKPANHPRRDIFVYNKAASGAVRHLLKDAFEPNKYPAEVINPTEENI